MRLDFLVIKKIPQKQRQKQDVSRKNSCTRKANKLLSSNYGKSCNSKEITLSIGFKIVQKAPITLV